jgi:Fission yeast centromere protein N-terminal domain
MPPIRLQRVPITDNQRQELRTYAKSIHPSPTQNQLVEWWLNKHNTKINQSTISKILSPKFAYLDDRTIPIRDNRKRKTPVNWPILEVILYDWQRLIEKAGAKVVFLLI